MPARRIYHPKRIKKTTHRALEKRSKPRQVTKAQLRQRFHVWIDEIRWDLVRFQRNPGHLARRELLQRILLRVHGVLRLKPGSHLLRELERECRYLAVAAPSDLRAADLGRYLDIIAMEPGKISRIRPVREG